MQTPVIITAGSHGTGDARTFWDVRRADTVVAITCVRTQLARP